MCGRYRHPNLQEDVQTRGSEARATLTIFEPSTVSHKNDRVKRFQVGCSRNHCKKPRGLWIDLSAHSTILPTPSSFHPFADPFDPFLGQHWERDSCHTLQWEHQEHSLEPGAAL